jgi:hypothetical protein
MPWNEGSSFDPSGNLLNDLFFGTVSAGVGAIAETAKLGYGYVTDPKNREAASANAKTFADNFGRYTPNGREWAFSDPVPDPVTRQRSQIQQLRDNRLLRSQGVQTGFDDEEDNRIEDKTRTKLEFSQRATMATPNSPAVINSSRPSDYAPRERFQADLYNYELQNQSRNYATNVNAGVARENNRLQSSDRRQATQLNAQNQRYGIDVNADTQRYGINVNAGVNRELGYVKTYAELQAALNRNQLQSRDNRFEITTKYGTQERMNQYNRNTLDKTEIAKEQIKAGTYGRSQSDINAMTAESNARKVNQEYNKGMMDYGRYQMEVQSFQNNMAKNNTAYADQRNDRSNDRSMANARYNYEMAEKRAERDRYYADLAEQRRQQRDDFKLRSQQIQNQIDLANRDFTLRSAESGAKVNQMNTDSRLKDSQFSATRADIGYNRNYQNQRSLAF